MSNSTKDEYQNSLDTNTNYTKSKWEKYKN